jgi:hypothetical protein
MASTSCAALAHEVLAPLGGCITGAWFDPQHPSIDRHRHRDRSFFSGCRRAVGRPPFIPDAALSSLRRLHAWRSGVRAEIAFAATASGPHPLCGKASRDQGKIPTVLQMDVWPSIW